ncbi:DUF2125 domain-containing protein [Ascidiaceihabitans sp.]|nr:DUF2125 domain-containing protein [Ascidiaceihabitans sp.]
MVNKFFKKTVFLTAIPFFIWTGYWTVSAYAIEHGISLTIEDLVTSKPDARFTVASVTGYPQDFSVGVSDILVGNKGSFKWATKEINLEAKSYQPNKINLDVSKPHSISSPFGSFEVDANVANLIIFFQPNFQLSLGNLEGLFKDISVSFDGLPDTRIDTVSARVEASQSDETSYNVSAEIEGFDLSEIFVDLESDYQYIPNLSFLAEVSLTRPLDRFLIYKAAPKLKMLTLRSALVTYGTTSISMNGKITVNGTEGLDGNIYLTVQGWKSLFNLANEVGFIEPNLEKFFYKALSNIAKQDGSENTINLTLNIKNNTVSYGILTLGVLP